MRNEEEFRGEIIRITSILGCNLGNRVSHTIEDAMQLLYGINLVFGRRSFGCCFRYILCSGARRSSFDHGSI